MADEQHRAADPATTPGSSRRGGRRPALPAEHAKRVQWGREWGAVGAAYKAARLAREAR